MARELDNLNQTIERLPMGLKRRTLTFLYNEMMTQELLLRDAVDKDRETIKNNFEELWTMSLLALYLK